jgi:ribonuclease HI
VLIGGEGTRLEFSGASASTTNNRMEITAAIEALRRLPAGIDVTIRTDSQYLVKTMTLGWKRLQNLDLWKQLDAEVAQRKVRWEWVRGHAGHESNERADELARSAAMGKTLNAPLDSIEHMSPTVAAQSPIDGRPQGGESSELQRVQPARASSNEARFVVDDEDEIARLLRPLLEPGESLRRCANCRRAFVAIGNPPPPPMRAYCSLAACQLKRRQNLQS